MTVQKTFDPFSLWKEYYQSAESYWEKTLEEQMKTEEFSEWLGKVLDMNLAFRKTIDQAAGQYLVQLNLPSREDLASLSSLVVNLDAKVDSLEEQIEDTLDLQSSENTTPFTNELAELKEEMKSIQTRLDEIVQLIEQKHKK